ncbi:MAG TPA: HipA N-terminal domain-containing protein [Flavipsychrobacter sp.]|nr:HipA N-terminal domain-containing protein [Flavipsychrobacter sp.]
MKQGRVMNNDLEAGILSKLDDGTYVFEYNDTYYRDDAKPPISLTLPKLQKQHTSKTLFPFFFNLLSEGSNRELQSIRLKIDKEDHFSLLLKTAAHETIGAIRVEEIS